MIAAGQEVTQQFTTVAERLDLTGMGIALQAEELAAEVNFSITVAVRETVDTAPYWATTYTITDTTLLSETHPVWLKVGALAPSTGAGISLLRGSTVDVRVQFPEKPSGTGAYSALRWALLPTTPGTDLGRTVRVTHNHQETPLGKAYTGSSGGSGEEDGAATDVGLLVYTAPQSLEVPHSPYGQLLMTSDTSHPVAPCLQIDDRAVRETSEKALSGAFSLCSDSSMVPSNPDGGGYLVHTSQGPSDPNDYNQEVTEANRRITQDYEYADFILTGETIVSMAQGDAHGAEASERNYNSPMGVATPRVDFVSASMYSYDVIHWSPLVDQARAGQNAGYDPDGSDWLRLTSPYSADKGQWTCPWTDSQGSQLFMWDDEEQVCRLNTNLQITREGIWVPKTYKGWRETKMDCPTGTEDKSGIPAYQNFPGYSDETPCMGVDPVTLATTWAKKKEYEQDVACSPDSVERALVPENADHEGACIFKTNAQNTFKDGVVKGEDGFIDEWDWEEKVEQEWFTGDTRITIRETNRCPDNTIELDPVFFEAAFGYEPPGYTETSPCTDPEYYVAAQNSEQYPSLTSYPWFWKSTYWEEVWKTAGAFNYPRAFGSFTHPTLFDWTEEGIYATFWTFDPKIGLYTGSYRKENQEINPYVGLREEAKRNYPYFHYIKPVYQIPVRAPIYYENLGNEFWFGDDYEVEHNQLSDQWARYPVVGMANFTIQLNIPQSVAFDRRVSINIYDTMSVNPLELERVLDPQTGAGANIAIHHYLPIHVLKYAGYIIKAEEAGLVSKTITLPVVIADMEPTTIDHDGDGLPDGVPKITAPLVEVFIELAPGKRVRYFLDDLLPVGTAEKELNPYNYYLAANLKGYAAAHQEEDHSAWGKFKHHFDLLAGVGSVVIGAATGNLMLLALGTLMLLEYSAEQMSGESLFWHFGAVAGYLFAHFHNWIYEDSWNPNMNLLTMTGNTAADMVIGTVFVTLIFLGVGTVAGMGEGLMNAFMHELKLAITVAHVTHVIPALLYAGGDYRNNFHLQHWAHIWEEDLNTLIYAAAFFYTWGRAIQLELEIARLQTELQLVTRSLQELHDNLVKALEREFAKLEAEQRALGAIWGDSGLTRAQRVFQSR